MWEAAGGDYDYKVETKVCDGCKKCGGNPPVSAESGVRSRESDDSQLSEHDELEELFDEIADIVKWQKAGSETDWSHYPYEYRRLMRVWDEAEREIAAIQQMRWQIFLKSKFKEQ